MTTEAGPCTSIRLGRTYADDRACALHRGHDGAHQYTVKPTANGWEDGK